MAEIETGRRGTLQQIQKSGAMMLLSEFLRRSEKQCALSRRDRLRIVNQTLVLLEMNYVHLPLKRAMHAINPIQRLKLLQSRLEMKGSELEGGMQFHKRLLEIFASLRDLHTLYLLPAPFKNKIAFLPLVIEQCFQRRRRGTRTKRIEKFLVTRIIDDILQLDLDAAAAADSFRPGVEVLYWNGVPIRRVIEMNGEGQAGSNLEARFARGLDNLTIRPLDTSLPPDEKWVDITYQEKSGREATIRLHWRVYDSGTKALATKVARKKRTAIDIKKRKINQFKTRFFAPPKVQVRQGYEDIFFIEVRQIANRDYGYIRLFSFDVDNSDRFVNEFRRVITAPTFPQEGLIIDVRGNPGGRIRSGERLLQLFTPRSVKPEIFEFINTPLNLEICRSAPKRFKLFRWADSIAEAVVTGATYSLGFPLNSEEDCNNIGQVYYGPVVLITDALSYSTTDMFAAGFQDNEIGDVLGTSDNTGAGGANVWSYEDLMTAAGAHAKSVFKPLPRDSDLVIALRRSIRVGQRDGRPLEELGVAPDYRHYMTRHDLMKRNVDLVRAAAKILRSKPVYALSVESSHGRKPALKITASSQVSKADRTKAIARVDVILNGRPHKSLTAKRGAIDRTTVALGNGKGKKNWVIQAYDHHNNIVALHRRK